MYMSKDGREELFKKTKQAEQNKLTEGEFITLESCKTVSIQSLDISSLTHLLLI